MRQAFLTHHGTLGMHWGTRKQEPPQVRLRSVLATPVRKKRALIALAAVSGIILTGAVIGIGLKHYNINLASTVAKQASAAEWKAEMVGVEAFAEALKRIR